VIVGLCFCARFTAVQLLTEFIPCPSNHSHFSFEVAIGMNGAVWLRAANNNVVEAIVIRNAILSADQTDDDAQVLAVVEQLVKASKLVGKSSNN